MDLIRRQNRSYWLISPLFVGWLLDKFSQIDPEQRRRSAVWLLVVSFVLGHLNILGFVFGWVSRDVMDAITNYLSWLAITITALDIVISTDIRKEQENSS